MHASDDVDQRIELSSRHACAVDGRLHQYPAFPSHPSLVVDETGKYLRFACREWNFPNPLLALFSVLYRFFVAAASIYCTIKAIPYDVLVASICCAIVVILCNPMVFSMDC